MELGFSWLYAPQARVPEARTIALLAVDENTPIDRTTLDIDFHYRWYPLGRELRQSLTVHGEVFYDFGTGRRDIFGSTVSQGGWGNTPMRNIESVSVGDRGFGLIITSFRVSRRWS